MRQMNLAQNISNFKLLNIDLYLAFDCVDISFTHNKVIFTFVRKFCTTILTIDYNITNFYSGFLSISIFVRYRYNCSI